MTDFTKLIADLQKQMKAVQDRLLSLKGKRRPHALAAVSGDKTAKAAIAKIDGDFNQAQGELATLEAALEEAEDLKVQAEQEAAETDRKRREEEALAIAAKIIEADGEFDALAGRMRDVLEKRRDLIAAFSRLGTVNSSYLSSLHRKLGPTAALRAVRLQEFVNIEHVDPGHSRPLAEQDAHIQPKIGWPDAAKAA